MGYTKMSNILTLGALEAEKYTKQKRKQHCGLRFICENKLKGGKVITFCTSKCLLPTLLVTQLTILANLLFSQDDNQVQNPVAEKLAQLSK